MNRTLSLPVQELIRASERVLVFATNHKGVPKDDFEAVLSCAYELIQDLKSTPRPLNRPLKKFKFVFSFVFAVGSFVTSKKLLMRPGSHSRRINEALG